MFSLYDNRMNKYKGNPVSPSHCKNLPKSPQKLLGFTVWLNLINRVACNMCKALCIEPQSQSHLNALSFPSKHQAHTNAQQIAKELRQLLAKHMNHIPAPLKKNGEWTHRHFDQALQILEALGKALLPQLLRRFTFSKYFSDDQCLELWTTPCIPQRKNTVNEVFASMKFDSAFYLPSSTLYSPLPMSPLPYSSPFDANTMPIMCQVEEHTDFGTHKTTRTMTVYGCGH